jgi:hypothetical protein
MNTSAPVLPDELPPHPRLLVLADGWAGVRAALALDPVSARILQGLRSKGKRLLEMPPLERVMAGRRLLTVSREALGRITTLSLLAVLEEDLVYTRRAIDELMAVAAFEDWNPPHFLDTAEMSLAVAIGYDWLYADLAPEQRRALEQALVEKGIHPSFHTRQPWLEKHNNWVQVCHAGLAAAAVALADLEPELAERTLRRAVEKVPTAVAVYGPDGAYPEGPTYWGYGTLFQVVLMDLLKRLRGNCARLDVIPGLAASAEYIRHVTAPSGEFFCY